MKNKVPDSKKASARRVEKDKSDKPCESDLFRIVQEYKLTPKQRRCIEVLLEATPYDPMESLAEKAGVSSRIFAYWRNQHTRFRNALHDSIQLLIGTEDLAMVKAGITEAKGGDLAWAKWLYELAGWWKPKEAGSVNVNVINVSPLKKEEYAKLSNREAVDRLSPFFSG